MLLSNALNMTKSSVNANKKKGININNLNIKQTQHKDKQPLQKTSNYTSLKGVYLTHPRSGAHVGTRAQRSLRIRMTMTQERSPLALAWKNKQGWEMKITVCIKHNRK